ncbi:MAG TPA: hypothetical protein VGB82_10590 [Alphaproteobacteria bacterium]
MRTSRPSRFRFSLRRAALCAAGVLALLLSGQARAADYHLLSDSELMALLNGATLDLTNIRDSNDGYHRFQPVTRTSEHGKLDVKNVNAHVIERGIWWVEEEQFCVLYQHVVEVRKRCFAVARDSADLRFIETRYELAGQHVERPHQWVPSAHLLPAPQSAGNYHLLTDDEIVVLMNGMTLDIKDHDLPYERLIHFQPVEKPGQHGLMDSQNAKGRGLNRGTWWVEDEQFCVFWTVLVGVRKRCFAVARDGDDVRFIETRWEQPGRRVDRPHTWVPSAQLFRSRGG